nr:ABC transporter substrate-binding protein [Sedimentibacter sp.]
MKKRITLFILAIVMVASIFTGCSKEVPKTEETDAETNESVETQAEEESLNTKVTEPVEISFWHAMSGANEEAIKKITDDFMAENKNIKVTLMNQGKYTDLFDKLMASAKANQLPTIAQIYSNRLSWYVSKDLVEDLSPYMEDEKTGFTQADFDDIPSMFFDDGIWDNKQYAIPFNKSQMVLYYNEGMLKDAGIEVPKTWEEWTEASKKLTVDKDNDGQPEVYGTVFANNLSTDIIPWFKQAGGTTIDRETEELLFDSDAAKEAVTFLNDMIQSKTARLAGDDNNANVPLQQGRAAMCVASTSALPYIESDTMEGIKINCAALPAHKTNDQLFYGTNVTVFNTSTDMEKQAAWEYIKFLTNTKNTAYFASQTGYIPVRKSAQEDPVFKAVLEEKPMKKIPFENMDNGFQGERQIGEINAMDALGDQLDLVFSGKKDIETALKDAKINGTKAMEEARNN